ncbi:MAG: diguanylate cyclase [Elusimicrobia bacterium]|nr:diguanylate cyclase [Elusimicrobiota bacterium]
MSARKRRRSDFEETRHLIRRIPHHWLYSSLGFLIGLGSPVGAFLMRFWMDSPILKSTWVRYELDYNFLFYAYMGLGTVVAFTLFGYIIGLRSERQRVHNRILSARLDELHLRSVTDSLTGAYTHGYLREILELEIQHSMTNKSPLSVLILDIDDFKRINDSHGHLFGDRVIKETAETVSANIRSEDILGRYGGDEFLVIMPGTERETSLHIARRVCGAIARNGFLATVSIGVATYTGQEPLSAQELLQQADANLYQAKREGKNQVAVTSAVKFPA